MSTSLRDMAADRWLTIGQASELVGVSVATMRRWCDAGELRAYTTPGGHRRLQQSAVLGLAGDRRSRPAGIACSGETRVRIVRAYRRVLRGDGPFASGLERLGEVERRTLRAKGALMVAELVDLLDSPPSGSAIHAAAAGQGAADCGRAGAQAGLSLDEVVALFVRLRVPFMHEIAGLMRSQGRDLNEATQILETASSAMDELLRAVVDGYQSARVSVSASRQRGV